MNRLIVQVLYYNIKNIYDELQACSSPARLSCAVCYIIYNTSYVHSLLVISSFVTLCPVIVALFLIYQSNFLLFGLSRESASLFTPNKITSGP